MPLKLYLSEEKMAGLRRGCLEEQIFQVHALLQQHHAGGEQVKRKVLATFSDGAVVAEETGSVYRYKIETIEGRLQVTSRRPVEDASLDAAETLPSEMAKAVLEGRKLPAKATSFDTSVIIWEAISEIMAHSPFLTWCRENSPLIEAQSWDHKKPVSRDKTLMLQVWKTARQVTVRTFCEEWDSMAFWLSRLPESDLAFNRGGETFPALVEYIKKIDTFSQLKFGPTDP